MYKYLFINRNVMISNLRQLVIKAVHIYANITYTYREIFFFNNLIKTAQT
jgi:hypothetical protein